MRVSGESAAVEAGEQTAEDEPENKTGVFMAACYQSGSLGLACFDTQTAEVAARTSLNACGVPFHLQSCKYQTRAISLCIVLM